MKTLDELKAEAQTFHYAIRGYENEINAIHENQQMRRINLVKQLDKEIPEPDSGMEVLRQISKATREIVKLRRKFNILKFIWEYRVNNDLG